MYFNFKKHNVETINLPYLPLQVDIADIQKNGKLYSDEDIAKLKAANLPDGRYNKEDLKGIIANPSYGIIKMGDQFYGIYKGNKKGKKVGEGSFGVVKLAQNLDTKKFIILKSLEKHITTKIEAGNLKKLGDLKFHLRHTQKTMDKYGYHLERDLIGMELAQGKELYKMIDSTDKDYNAHFNPMQRLIISKNILKSTKDAHANGLVHCDIKPENFVCDPATCKTKLIDLGFASQVEKSSSELNEKGEIKEGKKGEKKQNKKLNVQEGFKGSPLYMAPEILEQAAKNLSISYNEATEVYALGLTLAELFGLAKEVNPVHLMRGREKKIIARYEIINEKSMDFVINSKLPMDATIRKDLLSIIQRMTHNDPAERPCIEEAYRVINNCLNKEFNKEIKIGTIYVDDFLALTPTSQLRTLSGIEKEGINIIVLCDTSGKEIDINKYQAMIKKLDALHIMNVVPKVFTGKNSQDINVAAATYINQQFQAKPTLYTISSRGIEKTKIDLPTAVAKKAGFFARFHSESKGKIDESQKLNAINYLNRILASNEGQSDASLKKLSANHVIRDITASGSKFKIVAENIYDYYDYIGSKSKPIIITVPASKIIEFAQKQVVFENINCPSKKR